jgi:hypothetical protein
VTEKIKQGGASMTIFQARKLIIWTSLGSTAAVFVFFVVGPPLGFPLGWDQVQRVIEIVLPVFLGYLGTATHFLFKKSDPDSDPELGEKAPLLGLLIRGPLLVFGLAFTAILFAFGYSNRANAKPDSGMSVDQLAWALTAALGILTASTGVAVSYLFSLGDKRDSAVPLSQHGQGKDAVEPG